MRNYLFLFLFFTFFIGFTVSSKHKKASNVAFRVYVDPDTGEEVKRVEVTNECYEFTWLGPVEDNINNTRSCDDLVLSNPSLVTLPCFEPLVFTQGEYRLEGPNLTEIEQQCKAAETTDGSLCTPLCDLQDKMCVKMTYFNRDEDRTIEYQTHFCGTGIDVANNGRVLGNGCHLQESDPEYDIEVCFCDSDRCNGASQGGAVFGLVLLSMVLRQLSCQP